MPPRTLRVPPNKTAVLRYTIVPVTTPEPEPEEE
jgi:hypothetical protein